MKKPVSILLVLFMVYSLMIPAYAEGTISRAGIEQEDTVLNYARSLDGIDGLTFDKGSYSNSVYYLQYLLSNLGYLDPSGIDGDYGKNTANAIASFQNDEGLKETGYADVATQFLLTVKSPYADFLEKTDTVTISSNNYAVILWNDGTVYIGSVDKANQMVEGTYIYQTGDYYAGTFSNGLRSGNGTAHFANGDVYVGQWNQDKMHGNGKYYYGGLNSRETYDGNWVNNKMDGYGTYTLSNGTKVTGTWKNNKHISW